MDYLRWSSASRSKPLIVFENGYIFTAIPPMGKHATTCTSPSNGFAPPQPHAKKPALLSESDPVRCLTNAHFEHICALWL